MNGINATGTQASRFASSIIELSADEYDLDDLAGEIARTLEACRALSGETLPRTSELEIPQAR